MNVGYDVNLHGGNNYTSTVASFSFALASTPTGGALSFGRNLTIASDSNSNVSLTSTVSRPVTGNYSGSLNIADGDWASRSP